LAQRTIIILRFYMIQSKIRGGFSFLTVLFLFSLNFSYSQIMVMGDLVREKEVSIGTSFEDKVVLKNISDSLYYSIRVYQTDYRSLCNDSYEYPDISLRKVPRSNSSWVSYSPSYLTIAPQSYATVNYMVTIPNDTNLTGSYWSMIMLEIEGSMDSPGKAGRNLMMNSKFRYAITAVVHISNTGIRKLNVKNISLIKNEKNISCLNFEVENIGERAMMPDVLVNLFNNTTGSKVVIENKDVFKGRKTLICPENCAFQNIPIGILPVGMYQANIVFEASYDEVFSFQFNIKVDK
jgi:hypothetical protein